MKNYAITYTLNESKLQSCGISTEEAHEKVKAIFKAKNFSPLHKNGKFYISNNFNVSPMRTAFNIVDELKELEWFKKSVQGFAMMEVDSISDFTDDFK